MRKAVSWRSKTSLFSRFWLLICTFLGLFTSRDSHIWNSCSCGIVLALPLLSGCPSNPEVQLVEFSKNTVVYDEIIRINNCGGKGDSEQTASRQFATTIEFGAGVSAGYQSIVQGNLSAKYSEYRNTSKSQRLVAPPGTNMEFVLRWSDDVRAGNIQVNGKSGRYEVRIPISVEQISSRDLGCGVSGQQSQPTSATVLPSPTQTSQLPPSFYFERGTTDHQSGRYYEAIADFSTCVQLYPAFADCYNGLRMAYREIGDFQQSLLNHNKAIELNPRYDLYFERGVTYHQLRSEYDKAIQDFETCIVKNPSFCNCYVRMGMAYRDKGDFATALPYHNSSCHL